MINKKHYVLSLLRCTNAAYIYSQCKAPDKPQKISTTKQNHKLTNYSLGPSGHALGKIAYLVINRGVNALVQLKISAVVMYDRHGHT